MKKLKSKLVRAGDSNMQIVKRLAEAIQDAGGDPDLDFMRMVEDDDLLVRIGEMVVRSLFVEVGQVDPLDHPMLLSEIVSNLQNTDPNSISRHKEITANWRSNRAMSKNIPVKFRLMRPARTLSLYYAKILMSRVGLKIAFPEYLVSCIPSIRRLLAAQCESWGAHVYSSDWSSSNGGLIFKWQSEPARDRRTPFLQESLYEVRDKSTVSPISDLILVGPNE